MEIRISAKVFAEFVVGGPTKKASTVRAILKPKEPEAVIPSGYYKKAIGVIRGYHDLGNDHSFLAKEIKELHREIEEAVTPQARAKRVSNMTAVQSYMRLFSGRQWKVAKCPKIHYLCGDVRISGTPDLAVQDSGRLRLVKLGVRKEKETTDMVRLMLRVIYQASNKTLKISPEDITYFDIKKGEAISGHPSDRRLAQTIDAGCRVLQEMVGSRPS